MLPDLHDHYLRALELVTDAAGPELEHRSREHLDNPLTPHDAVWFSVPSFLDAGSVGCVSREGLSDAISDRPHMRSRDLQLFLAGMSAHQPQAMADLLMDECVDGSHSDGGTFSGSDLVAVWYNAVTTWREATKTSLPSELRGAAGVRVAAACADQRTDPRLTHQRVERELRLAWIGLDDDSPEIDLPAKLAIVDRISDRSYITTKLRASEVRHWERQVDLYLEEDKLGDLAAMTGWLLAWNSHSANTLVAVAASDGPGPVADAVRTIAEHGAGRIARLASGIVADLDDGPESRLQSASSWLHNRRHFGRPQSMRAPSGTWLDSAELENLIHHRINAAAESWSWDGHTQEEHMTGALLEQLAMQLNDLNGTMAASTVRLDAQLTRRKDERVNGADLGLVVEVDVPNALKLEKAHLIQIKRTSGAAPPRWSIGIQQLIDLIDHDETATYWLLSELAGSRVVCVPASFLLGVLRSTDPDKKKGTFTVRLEQVASASVPLEDLLCDLLVGLWLGSRSDRLIAEARGNDAYRPANLLRLQVRLSG